VTSPRQRMGVTGREMLRWLAQPFILQSTRTRFETLLNEVAEYAEEWLTSAQSMGLANRTGNARVLPWDRSSPSPVPGSGRKAGNMPRPVPGPAASRNGRASREHEHEHEFEFEYEL